jgi:predicted CXXCH cytochrome family protein
MNIPSPGINLFFISACHHEAEKSSRKSAFLLSEKKPAGKGEKKERSRKFVIMRIRGGHMKTARRVPSNKYFALSSLLILFLCWSGSIDADAAVGVVDKNHTSCTSCHRMEAEKITRDNLFPEGIDPSSICLDCHHYRDNHHPVNFVPREGFQGQGGERFPLFDNEIRCLTCHEVHGGEGLAGKPKLLRGGPYINRNTICFRCHEKDLNRKVNPHHMTDENGTVRKINGVPACLFCHEEIPDQTKDSFTVTFKADVAFLCWRCHPPMTNDSFFKGHFLAKPKKRTLDYMMKVQAEDGVSFPLLNRDRITCSTCHNPHQSGVISNPSGQAGTDNPHRLRMPEGSLCAGCHDMYGRGMPK